jgi:hypothetical protein
MLHMSSFRPRQSVRLRLYKIGLKMSTPFSLTVLVRARFIMEFGHLRNGSTARPIQQPVIHYDYALGQRQLTWHPNNLEGYIHQIVSEIPQPSPRLFGTSTRTSFERHCYSTDLLPLCRGFISDPGYYAASVDGKDNNCLFNAASLLITGQAP